MTDQPKQGNNETPEGHQPTLRLPDHQPEVPRQPAPSAGQEQGQSPTPPFAQPGAPTQPIHPQQPYAGQQPGAGPLRPAGTGPGPVFKPVPPDLSDSPASPTARRRRTLSRAAKTPMASPPTTACQRPPKP